MVVKGQQPVIANSEPSINGYARLRDPQDRPAARSRPPGRGDQHLSACRKTIVS
jgi:hypothetical protein